MAKLDFIISYQKNKGNILSPAEVLELYFYGVPIQDKAGGSFSSEALQAYIESAQQEFEKLLNIKCVRQVVEEDIDFFFDDFRAWGYIRTSYLVNYVDQLNGFVNSVKQIEYPREWLSTKKSSEGLYYRHIYLVPQHTMGAQTNSVVYSGVVPHLGFLGLSTIPNYWRTRYVTGFEKLPMDLVNMIGKLAAINLFNILGDIVLGAGIASMSVGIDGLSQSISTTSSAENSAYSARIKMYWDDLKKGIPRVESYYKGITVLSL